MVVRNAGRVTGSESHPAVQALGSFSDWLRMARAGGLWKRDDDFPLRAAEVLRAVEVAPKPRDARVLARWTRDGVDGELVSW